ncbi:MAG TPA: hypothetical protein VGB73_20210 [Pyrinomonadaceae bacterium]|jgi:hypothetical protein
MTTAKSSFESVLKVIVGGLLPKLPLKGFPDVDEHRLSAALLRPFPYASQKDSRVNVAPLEMESKVKTTRGRLTMPEIAYLSLKLSGVKRRRDVGEQIAPYDVLGLRLGAGVALGIVVEHCAYGVEFQQSE